MEEAMFWLLIIVLAFVFLFLPQWQMRKRQQKKMAGLAVGDRIVTIGGFIGTLTALDLEQDRAKLKLAEGVEVEIVTGAIGRKLE